MKNYKDFIKETLNVNGANVANFTPFLFSRDEDLLSQDYQTPAEPGEAKWRFANQNFNFFFEDHLKDALLYTKYTIRNLFSMKKKNSFDYFQKSLNASEV